MSGFQTLFQNPEQIPFIILVLVIASAFHEFAHAAVATWFGDPTPREQGRLTLDPRPHLDMVGTILFVLIGFGWAKPVETNPSFYKYPRLMDVLVSLAGPLMNLVLAVGSMMVYTWYASTGYSDSISVGSDSAIRSFLNWMFHYNFVWFLLNMLPLPPFDGYHVVRGFLNPIQRFRLSAFEQYGMFLFFAIILIDPLFDVTLGPYFGMELDFLQWLGHLINPWFD